MGERAGIAVAPAVGGNRGCTQEAGAVVDADAFTGGQASGERAADHQSGVVGAGAGGDGGLDDADVVGDGRDRRRGGGGAGIDAGAIGATGGGLVTGGIGNPGRITHALAMSKAAAIAIAPARAGNRGGSKETGAVVDANAFSSPKGSGERAADRQGGVVGAASRGDAALDDADVVADRGDRRQGGGGSCVNGDAVAGQFNDSPQDIP